MSRTPPDDLGEFYLASYDRLVRVLTLAAGSCEAGEEIVQDAFVQLVPRWSTVCAYDDPATTAPYQVTVDVTTL